MKMMVLESKVSSTNNPSNHHHHHHHPNDYGSLGGLTVDDCKITPHHVVVEIPPPTVPPPISTPPLSSLQQHNRSKPSSPSLPTTLTTTIIESKAVGTMTSNQGLNDLYQRTPLLSSNNTTNQDNASTEWREGSNGGGGGTNGKIIFKSQDELEDAASKKKRNLNSNGIVKIDMPTNGNSTNGSFENPKFPPEYLKTFYAFLILVFNLLLNTTSLAIVHEKVPDKTVYKPLPDIFLDNFLARDWTLYLSEVLIMISSYVMVIVILVHRHRCIIIRRLFLMLSLLYLMRSITMFVTVLPMSSTTYKCEEKANSTDPMLIIQRVIKLASGFGLSINGKHTYCGDYIYSGHTTILVMSYLMIKEYSPKRYFLLHYGTWIVAAVGVVMVLVAHGHYTVDVLIAYYITTRLFWLYHTICNTMTLKQRTPNNYLSNVWWFRIFQYFEANVGGSLPRQYDSPAQCLRKLVHWFQNRGS